MYLLDFYDIVFFIKALKQPCAISTYFIMCPSAQQTLDQPPPTNLSMSAPTITIPEISTLIDYLNYGSFINLNHSISTIKTTIYTYLQDHFKNNFASDKPCTYHFCCRCSNCYNLGAPSNFSVM